MVHSVNKALDDAQYDYGIKVVIIKANGKGFCSGHVPDGGYPEFKADSMLPGKYGARPLNYSCGRCSNCGNFQSLLSHRCTATPSAAGRRGH